MKFVMTSPYGGLEAIRSGIAHTGIDLAMPIHTKLRSVVSGIVEKVTDYKDNIGKGVIIRGNDGTRYIYGHMEQVNVIPGEKVFGGELIGFSGNSGNSTGPHLHFGMWRDGHYVDPSSTIEKVDALTGNHTFNLFETKGWLGQSIGEHLREQARESTHEILMGVLDAVGQTALDLTYAITLVGSGILIVLKAVGFEHRWLKPGVLITIHVLLRFLLGGVLG